MMCMYLSVKFCINYRELKGMFHDIFNSIKFNGF